MILTTVWITQEATLPTGLLNGSGVVGLLVILFWMLASGRLATGREIREKNQRIEYLQATNAELLKQNGVLLRASVPATNAVMNALHQALENEEA